MAGVRIIVNAYREKYLSSEHWFGLKTRTMTHYGCRCAICGKADIANDVHHIKYKNLMDVDIDDLRVLCREHHKLVHQALDRHPQIFDDYKDYPSEVLWSLTIKEIGIESGIELPPRPHKIGRFKRGFIFEKGRMGFVKKRIDPIHPDGIPIPKAPHPGEMSHLLRTNLDIPKFKAKRWKAPPVDMDKILSRH